MRPTTDELLIAQGMNDHGTLREWHERITDQHHLLSIAERLIDRCVCNFRMKSKEHFLKHQERAKKKKAAEARAAGKSAEREDGVLLNFDALNDRFTNSVMVAKANEYREEVAHPMFKILKENGEAVTHGCENNQDINYGHPVHRIGLKEQPLVYYAHPASKSGSTGNGAQKEEILSERFDMGDLPGQLQEVLEEVGFHPDEAEAPQEEGLPPGPRVPVVPVHDEQEGVSSRCSSTASSATSTCSSRASCRMKTSSDPNTTAWASRRAGRVTSSSSASTLAGGRSLLGDQERDDSIEDSDEDSDGEDSALDGGDDDDETKAKKKAKKKVEKHLKRKIVSLAQVSEGETVEDAAARVYNHIASLDGSSNKNKRFRLVMDSGIFIHDSPTHLSIEQHYESKLPNRGNRKNRTSSSPEDIKLKNALIQPYKENGRWFYVTAGGTANPGGPFTK
ncbi:hypothetical protein THAOC_20328, partial [Thalassiosira oceanica]